MNDSAHYREQANEALADAEELRERLSAMRAERDDALQLARGLEAKLSEYHLLASEISLKREQELERTRQELSTSNAERDDARQDAEEARASLAAARAELAQARQKLDNAPIEYLRALDERNAALEQLDTAQAELRHLTLDAETPAAPWQTWAALIAFNALLWASLAAVGWVAWRLFVG